MRLTQVILTSFITLLVLLMLIILPFQSREAAQAELEHRVAPSNLTERLYEESKATDRTTLLTIELILAVPLGLSICALSRSRRKNLVERVDAESGWSTRKCLLLLAFAAFVAGACIPSLDGTLITSLLGIPHSAVYYTVDSFAGYDLRFALGLGVWLAALPVSVLALANWRERFPLATRVVISVCVFMLVTVMGIVVLRQIYGPSGLRIGWSGSGLDASKVAVFCVPTVSALLAVTTSWLLSALVVRRQSDVDEPVES